MYALADRIGGAQGRQMRAALSGPLFAGLKSLDQIYGDAEFSTELGKMERELRAASAKMTGLDWEKPGTWGLQN